LEKNIFDLSYLINLLQGNLCAKTYIESDGLVQDWNASGESG